MKFLFLEDEKEIVSLLVRLLLRDGFTQFDYINIESKEEFEREMPLSDVLFIDCSLPNFSCEEALLLWHEAGEKQPFIIVSGTITNDKGKILTDIGATEFILKDTPHLFCSLTRRAMEKFAINKS